MSQNADAGDAPPRSPRVVLARRQVAGDGISLMLASEDVRASTDWFFEESHHVFVVHLAGRLRRMESVFSTGLATDVLPTAGDIWAVPAGCRYSAMAQGSAVSFAEFSVAHAPGDAEMPARAAHRDPFLHAASLRAAELAARDDDLARMALDSLLHTLQLHFRDAYLRGSPSALESRRDRLLHFSTRQRQLILDRVEDAMSGPLTIDDLARCVGLSAAHLMQGFKASFGTTPWQFVLRSRLDKAASLLAETGTAASEIATATGFASASHFATSFARHFGMSPTAYRRLGRSRAAGSS